ncbi:MAG: hypothetical protein CMK41_00310 [Porticoccaceae bacterium]|nr:hypothetical protein [Porticoccaceae bacterium]|tara:strand:- start:2650 stop:4170 length:1521 start_codon:yes stop_codon:yes gene_type:complete
MEKNNKIFKTEQIKLIEKIYCGSDINKQLGLMERAAKCVMKNLIGKFGKPKKLYVLCGHSNNGADGYLCALIGNEMNISVTIIEEKNVQKRSLLAETTRRKCIEQNIAIEFFDDSYVLDTGVIIDALIGTGLTGVLRGPMQKIIKFVNQQTSPVISIDMPSGIVSDTGYIPSVAVRADLTVCLIALKPGLLSGKAREYIGELVVDDLKIDLCRYPNVSKFGQLLDIDKAIENLPKRSAAFHKYDAGLCVIVGGDFGMGGAPIISAEGSMRIGSGLTRIVTRPDHVIACLIRNPECLVDGINTVSEARRLTDKASAIVIGPGLGKSPWSREMLKTFMNTDVPIILDADALSLIAEKESSFDYKAKKIVITPHAGEAAKLLGCSVREVEENRYAAVNKLQSIFGGVVLLKGPGSILSSLNSDELFVCPYGNAALATAGSGDLLSGLIGGLVAQGKSIQEAAEIGVSVHSYASDMALHEYADKGLIATDLLAYIKQIINGQNFNYHNKD